MKNIDFSPDTQHDCKMRFVWAFLGFLVLVVSVAVFQGTFSYFKNQQIEKAAARLTLYRNSLESEIRHFAHLPFHLSLDPVVAQALAGGGDGVLDHRLARFSQSAGLEAIYLMDHSGLTLSASNAKSPVSFKGQNYSYRPYFQAALRGELGEFYGIGATTGEPGYFYAIAVRHPEAGQDGVIAIKSDLAPLQHSWQESGERILLANSDGVVLLASDPAWRYRTLRELTRAQRERIDGSRQFANEPLTVLGWTLNEGDQTVEVDGKEFLYLRTADLPNSWSLHYLEPQDPVVIGAWLSTGVFVILAMTSFIAFQLSRARQIGAALKKSEKEEALLRQANEKLAVEIEERRVAEQTLKKTQAELELAGRLAALGQLASSVTHELGQPIAAMRNQLTVAEMKQGTSLLTDKLQALIARMENITRQLKFFSRKGRDQFEKLDLRVIMDAALELIEPNVNQIGAQLIVERAQTPLFLKGNQMRLEQVVTNILRNALDAVDGAAIRQIDVSMGCDDKDVWFKIADTGHGLGDHSLDDLHEPFVTTRESGKGMGLGLTISAGIVQDHGGTITADNRKRGGAMFCVRLPREDEEKAS